MLPVRHVMIALLTAGVAACAQPSPPTPVDATERVAFAAGQQVREERRAFSVYPAIVSPNAPIDASPRRLASALRALEQFRRGAKAKFADTLLLRDPVRALPDSLNQLVTLAGLPLVAADSATVDVFSFLAKPANGLAEMAIHRYLFRRAADQWVFVRRALVSGS